LSILYGSRDAIDVPRRSVISCSCVPGFCVILLGMNANPELTALFEADQADRKGELHPDMWLRDAARRQRVEELINEGGLRVAEDYLHAAFIFQHGDKLEHYWQAHELALQAVDLGLAAAAYDRWLMHQNLPQKFGTQYQRRRGVWELYTFDPTTTDAERARWDVPSLQNAQAYVAKLNGEELEPQPLTALPIDGQFLGRISVPGLDVEVVAIEESLAGGLVGGMPDPEPFDRSDVTIPVPEYLPAGLQPRRLGEGFCAVDEKNTVVLTWFELLLPPGQPLHLAWNLSEGPAPTLQIHDLDTRQAILVSATWSAVAPDRPPVIVARAGPDTCWIVGGHLPHEELVRVIGSLPAYNR
jgi:hypothetical protein